VHSLPYTCPVPPPPVTCPDGTVHPSGFVCPAPPANVFCDGVAYPPGFVCPYYEYSFDDWYPDFNSFFVELLAYAGLEEVDFDGFLVRFGSKPAIQFHTNGDGSISRVR
jgi:hypothetical protein